MNDRDALAKAHWLINQSGQKWSEQLSVYNFSAFSSKAADAVRFGMNSKQRDSYSWLPEWAERFAKLAGDFDKRLKSDPMMLYRPRTPKHQAFHDSTAFIRYALAANGVGKTNLAFAESLWCAQGARHWSGLRGNAIMVSTGHTIWSERVFIPKLITGEDGDPLTPMIPENGRYFHSFDMRKYRIRVACEECAEVGKPKQCTHTKDIMALSADSGLDRTAGFTARNIGIDELIPVEIYRELRQRVRRGGAYGRMMVTSTPLAGPDHWTIKELYDRWKKRPGDNWYNLETKDERYVEVFIISKYDCIGSINGPTLGEIEAEKLSLPPSEFRARVLGEAVPLGDSLFNLHLLDAQDTDNCRPAENGKLELASGTTVEALEYADHLIWQPTIHSNEDAFEGVYIWEHPQEGAIYAVGADTASGVGEDRADASVSYVFKIVIGAAGRDTKLEMVGAWYSHDDTYKYAEEVKKIATYFNMALVIPEVTGIGSAFMTALTRQLAYPFVYMGETPAEQTNAGPEAFYGVKTSAQSKPWMIEALKVFVDQKRIIIRDKEAISECRTFQKTRTESGLSYRYGAASGAHDDRVLAMSFVALTALRDPDQLIALATVPILKAPTTTSFNYDSPRPKPWIM